MFSLVFFLVFSFVISFVFSFVFGQRSSRTVQETNVLRLGASRNFRETFVMGARRDFRESFLTRIFH